jgi:hypothetical protein
LRLGLSILRVRDAREADREADDEQEIQGRCSHHWVAPKPAGS